MIEIKRKGFLTECYIDEELKKVDRDYDEIVRFAEVQSIIKGESIHFLTPRARTLKKRKEIVNIHVLPSETCFN